MVEGPIFSVSHLQGLKDWVFLGCCSNDHFTYSIVMNLRSWALGMVSNNMIWRKNITECFQHSCLHTRKQKTWFRLFLYFHKRTSWISKIKNVSYFNEKDQSNQWSLTYLAPGTSFMEDNFCMGWNVGVMVSGWFKCSRICAPMRI